MFIRKPRGIGFKEIAFVTVLGFLGGVYIWKPLIQKFHLENKEEQLVPPKEVEDKLQKPN